VRPKLKRSSVIIFIVCLAVLISGVLKGREDYMQNLPVYRHYRCKLCHQSTMPGSGDLNDFGSDFRSNGYTWDEELADMDSDGDQYKNGLELGDEDGDGEPEVLVERSNPGDPLNNPTSVDKDTWGVIKNLFKD
jgi:hypothetical protein